MPRSPGARSGKSSGPERLQREPGLAGRERQPLLLGIAPDVDLAALGELPHDVVQHVGGHGRGAGAPTSARTSSITSRSRSVALSSSVLAVGAQEHVGKDRYGRAPLDDARYVAKRTQEFTAFNNKPHSRLGVQYPVAV